MTDHDKFCDSRTNESWCDCRKIDVIRADEREHMRGEIRADVWRSLVRWAARAEAVAARLVEVICEQEAHLRRLRPPSSVFAQSVGLHGSLPNGPMGQRDWA